MNISLDLFVSVGNLFDFSRSNKFDLVDSKQQMSQHLV